MSFTEKEIDEMLDYLIYEMMKKMEAKDLSEDYLKEHNYTTREEAGIGEYLHGITMIPCSWVYPLLVLYQRSRNEKRNSKSKVTNRDKIRQMSNEELAKLFIRQSKCFYCLYGRDGTALKGLCDWKCTEGIKAYLDMEVE